MDDLISWLRAQLDDDEQVAKEASRDSHGWTETGEHWRWEETNDDRVITIDPVTDEFVGDSLGDGYLPVALRSVEEYPTDSVGSLSHFIVPHAEEVPAICGLHIARWDPARVLAEVDAKRRILDDVTARLDPRESSEYAWESVGAETDGMAWTTLRLIALPYADRPGYRDEWRPKA